MASNDENAQNLARPASPSSLLSPLSVFPPLPPLPPPDSPRSSTKQFSPSSESAANWTEARPRKFGVKMTNTIAPGEGSYILRKPETKLPFSEDMAAAQVYYKQYQYFPRHGTSKKTSTAHQNTASTEKKSATTTKPVDYENETDGVSTASSPTLWEFSSTRDPTQLGRTIWSITPKELTKLAAEMDALKKISAGPDKKMSYAEASKRNLSGNRCAQETEVVEVESLPRTFKKYYGLPIIASSAPHHSAPETLEEKEVPTKELPSAASENEHTTMLNYSRIFGLSASTPTFYPRQTTDTNELIQMLKASLTPKKIAPHMDWWPGDWKCTNCGNHNFSYRDTCKRCRVGRLEDAGFIFPPSSANSSP